MSETTAISWTDATFNPWEGCQKVGPGCDHCYAEARNARFGGGTAVNWGPGAPRRRTSDANWRKPLLWEREHEAFALMHGRRRRVFCASLADVFDNEVGNTWRSELLSLIYRTPHLDWLLLTKRIGNVPALMQECTEPDHQWALPPNVWLGATVVNQAEADRDIPKLLAVPARVRFLSIEPMLGPIELQRACLRACLNGGTCYPDGGRRWIVDSSEGGLHVECICSRLNGLHWVIAGGESGSHARPAHPDWFRSLRDQCAAAGVPFHFKQWGEWTATGPIDSTRCSVDLRGRVADGALRQNFPPDAESGDGWQTMYRAGKKVAGRLLDGVEHNGFPA